jgi:hypothetical protein
LEQLTYEAETGDPLVSATLARARFLAGDVTGARSIVGDVHTVLGHLGLWWAVRGDVLVGSATSDEHSKANLADAYLQAVANDPFLPEAACGWARVSVNPDSLFAASLCEAAKAWSPGTRPD